MCSWKIKIFFQNKFYSTLGERFDYFRLLYDKMLATITLPMSIIRLLNFNSTLWKFT